MTDEDETTQAGTPRHRLRRCLERGGAWTARELSQQASLSEREVVEHLAHLERTLQREGAALTIEPALCLECGFRFDERTRAKRPSRCPGCRSERIAPPRFALRG